MYSRANATKYLRSYSFMFGVRVRVEKTDGDAFRSEPANHTRNFLDLGRTDGFEHSAFIGNPLAHFESVPPWDKRWQAFELQVVQLWPVLPPNFQDVPESLSCYQSHLWQ